MRNEIIANQYFKDKYTLRPLEANEHLYIYENSQQINLVSGHVGYLRAYYNGDNIYTAWFGFLTERKTDEFTEELDDVINALQAEDRVLCDLKTLRAYYNNNEPLKNRKECAFRVDAQSHSFLFRINPFEGTYNFYCYCYKKEALDAHLSKSNAGIRFITSDYEEKFILPDGAKIRLRYSNGETVERTCRYIDEAHVEIGSFDRKIYHICEIAEIFERNGTEVFPMSDGGAK